jgi:aminopeptidase-like protein
MDADLDDETRIDALFDELWPFTRSITGPGLRRSLETLQDHIPLTIEGKATGSQVFDWEIPPEWRIQDAHLTGPDGVVYADYNRSNLEVVNYSEPVDESVPLDELEPHLYTHPELPEATPYVTSYYDRNWGFCLPDAKHETLPEGDYHAYIDSEFVDGELNYGHATLEGETDREFLLSTYLCHPSMANNELSGPLVMALLYDRIRNWDRRQHTYRFVVVPETIGSLTYLSEYGDQLRERLDGGLVLTCLGGPNATLSYKTTRGRDAIIDETVRHLDQYSGMDFEERPFTPTGGSDERQYCSPGFDLPVGQMARTVYNQYDEYHTSFDNKEFMQIDQVIESADTIENVLQAFEYAGFFKNQNPYGEPMLSKRDLYTGINSPCTWSDSTDSIRNDDREFVDRVLTVLNYSDGTHPMVEIASQHDWSIEELIPVIDRLEEVDLLAPSENRIKHGDRVLGR